MRAVNRLGYLMSLLLGLTSAMAAGETTSRPPTGQVYELSDKTFVVNSKAGNTLVMFYADWCQPCQRTLPIADTIAAHFTDQLLTGRVDIERFPALASAHQIRSVPQFALFHNGELVKTIPVARQAASMIEQIEQALQNLPVNNSDNQLLGHPLPILPIEPLTSGEWQPVKRFGSSAYKANAERLLGKPIEFTHLREKSLPRYSNEKTIVKLVELATDQMEFTCYLIEVRAKTNLTNLNAPKAEYWLFKGEETISRLNQQFNLNIASGRHAFDYLRFYYSSASEAQDYKLLLGNDNEDAQFKKYGVPLRVPEVTKRSDNQWLVSTLYIADTHLYEGRFELTARGEVKQLESTQLQSLPIEYRVAVQDHLRVYQKH